jgi:hypothetical protein
MTTKSLRKIPATLLALAVSAAAALPVHAAPPKAPKPETPNSVEAAKKKRSESQYARELSRLGQVQLLKYLAQRDAGKPEGGLFAVQLTYADWANVSKDRTTRPQVVEQYVSDMNRYLGSAGATVDGFWALDQAKFILGPLAETTVNRMEYWSNNPKDRQVLKPLAQMATQLLQLARVGLQNAQEVAQTPVFNEAAWTAAYNAAGEVDYYGAYAGYFTGLASEPGDPNRAKVLNDTAATLKWADEDDSDPAQASGIKYQCLLLRGKIYSEASQHDKAAKDFTTAGDSPKAPGWVKYQSHYQAVVNKMRKRDGTAVSELEKFKQWIATDPETSKDESAKVSEEMLHYRVEAYAAAALPDAKARQDATNKALSILGDLVEKQPRYREMIFEELAAQAPEKEAFANLPPLQALAVAWTKAQSVRDDKLPESKKVLGVAVDAASGVLSNPAASTSDRKEATLIAAVVNARLGRLVDAVKMDAAFASLCFDLEGHGAAKDPRAGDMLDAAIGQLHELRAAVPPGQPQPKEIIDLSELILGLKAGKLNDPKWRYPLMLTLVQQGKLDEAVKVGATISQSDPNYFASRYQLLRINLQLLQQSKDEAVKQQNARNLIQSCEAFLNTNPSATPGAQQQLDQYRNDILLIEASTALDPLKDNATALAALAKLEAQPNLTPQVKGVILRDRIQAGDKTAMKKYMDEFPADAPNIIRGMIAEDIAQIDRIEKNDPAKSKELATDAVELVKSLIESSKSATPKDIYSYRQILADMQIRAGQYADAIALFKELQDQTKGGDPKDLFNFMGEARAIFADGKWNMAHDYFARILPKLSLGSDSFWLAYLRIIQCNEAIGTPEAKAANKKVLQDLRASYSDGTGGTAYKDDYMQLLKKYDIP